MQLAGNILHRDADDGPDLLVAQAFEPQQDSRAVHQTQSIDTGIQAPGLQRPVVSILKRIDVHAQGDPFTTPPPLFVSIEAAVETR